MDIISKVMLVVGILATIVLVTIAILAIITIKDALESVTDEPCESYKRQEKMPREIIYG